MNVNKYKDYFEFNGHKYVLKETEQIEIDRLYYQIALDRDCLLYTSPSPRD